MDMITLAMAKSYTNSQRMAFVEPAVTLSWNGDMSSNEIVKIDGAKFVKLSSDFYDLTRVTSITIGNLEQEITGDNSLVQTENGFSMLSSADGTTGWAASVDHDESDISKGTYLFNPFSAITFAETIHPIDPKFIPGAVLPVVEITSAEYPESGVVALSAEESTALTAAAEMNVGAVIRFTHQSSPITIVGHLLLGTMFVETINAPIFRFMRGADGWSMGVSE